MVTWWGKRAREQCEVQRAGAELYRETAGPATLAKLTTRRHSHSVYGEDGDHEEVVAREMAGVVSDPLGWISVVSQSHRMPICQVE